MLEWAVAVASCSFSVLLSLSWNHRPIKPSIIDLSVVVVMSRLTSQKRDPTKIAHITGLNQIVKARSRNLQLHNREQPGLPSVRHLPEDQFRVKAKLLADLECRV